MAFPSVRSSRTGTPTVGTSHTVQLPATVVAGDYLFVVFSSDGEITITWDNSSAGTWTLGYTDQFNGAGGCTVAVYYKVANGTEDAVNLSIGTSATESTSYYTAAIQDADGIAFGTSTDNSNTNTTTPDPPSLTHGWGAVDAMFWVVLTYDNGVASTVSSYPSSYANNQNDIGTGTGVAKTAVASRNLNAASDDPGTFTISNSRPTIVNTMAFKPLPDGLSITSVSPSNIDSGETVTIVGTGFGASQGLSLVKIGNDEQAIQTWGDQEIVFTASRGTQSMGNATLTVVKV